MKDFSECCYDELIDFCNNYCKDCVDFIELKEKIFDIEIKSKQQQQKSKIPKFTLQLYVFFLSESHVFSNDKI